MNRRRNEVTDEELAEVLRRGRFEDLWGITAIVGLLAEAALAMALQFGAPMDVLLPVMAFIAVTIVIAAVMWTVGTFRTNLTLNRLSPPPRSPVWAYVLPIGLAIAAGIAFAIASDTVQRWLWAGLAVAGVVVFMWMQWRQRTGTGGTRNK